MLSKTFEFPVGDKTVGFRFNMLSHGKACRLENCRIDQLFERIGLSENKEGIDLVSICNFFYAAAINYTEGKGLKVDYTVQDVSDWLEHNGIDKTMEIMRSAMQTPEIKNQEAPSETEQSDTKI
jgi:hypothetical protein